MKKVLSIVMAVVLLSSAAFAQVNNARRVSPKEAAEFAKTTTVLAPMAKKMAANVNGAKTIISSFPYNEGFENGTNDWTFIDSDGDGVNWFLASTISLEPRTGNDCIVSNSYDNNTGVLTPDNWMISSQMQLPTDASEFELSWYDAAQDPSYPAENYAVYIATSNTVAAFTATTPVFTTVLSTDAWTKRTVSLAAYAGQSIYIAFRHFNVSDQYMMKIDDIAVGIAGAPEISINGRNRGIAGDPMNFTATCSDTTIAINWTLESATPATATGSSVNATWDNAGTYNVAVSATNARGTATDTLVVTIISCETVTTFPWTEDFESGELGCWQAIDNDGDELNWEIYNSGHDGSNYSVTCYYSSTDTQDNYLISQALCLPAEATNFELSYFVKGSTSYPEDYEVLISTTGSSIEDFTTVLLSETFGGDWTKRMVSLGAYAGQTIRIAFHHTSFDALRLYIDDIKIDGPSAPDVHIIAPESATTNDHVMLFADIASGSSHTTSWTIQNGTPATASTDSVEVQWVGVATGDYMITVTATNEIGSASDTVMIHILNCDGNITTFPYNYAWEDGQGCWMNIDADGDGMGWEIDPEAGAYSYSCDPLYMMFGMVEPINTINYLVSPIIEVPATGYTRFSIQGHSVNAAAGYIDSVDFLVTTGDPTDLSSYTTLVSQYPVTASAAHDYGFDMSQYAGQQVQVAIVHHTNGGTILVVEEVIINNATEGIDEVNNHVSIYPNPATSTLNVVAEGVQMIEIIDVNGRTMMTSRQAGVINISNLSNGIYMVRTITNDGVSLQKVIKK